MLFELKNAQLSVVVSTRGGTLLQLNALRDEVSVPLLRPSALKEETTALDSACFPMLPFCNRVEGNQFDIDDQHYTLQTNTTWDKHYLHGDAWLADWQVLSNDTQSVELSYEHTLNKVKSPYAYHAKQKFTLMDNHLSMVLSITNHANTVLPFGLGWHPYFVQRSDTTLCAPANRMAIEKENWLSGSWIDVPDQAHFNQARTLPRQWMNNGFTGWNGLAKINWPDVNMTLDIVSTPLLQDYFVFVSDTNFDPLFKHDFFCFEPMTHAANDHHAKNFGRLKLLEPQQSFSVCCDLVIHY